MFDILLKLFSKKENINLEEIVNQNAYLVDVRSPSEYATGNVKGSLNIPVTQIATQLTKFKGKKIL